LLCYKARIFWFRKAKNLSGLEY